MRGVERDSAKMVMDLDRDVRFVISWLRERNSTRLEELWRMADSVRRAHVGDAVHLRGLIEISNVCVRQCAYCGLRAGNTRLARYRMKADEILACARNAVELGYGTVVLQGGEDYGLSAPWVEDVIRRIKRETPLSVTLGLGERPEKDLVSWRRAGADRYFLRFETSDMDLYRQIHPSLPSRASDRIELLRTLQAIGYETGSGIMIGIPGQTMSSLAQDILLFRSLDLDMIGVGPFLPHPETPLGTDTSPLDDISCEQVPNTEVMVYIVLALARIVCPDANIPSTTALAVLNPLAGYELGLMRGANVIMPNITPFHYRSKYDIYPGKAGASPSGAGDIEIPRRIEALGRTVGKGPGRRIRHVQGTQTGRVLALDTNGA